MDRFPNGKSNRIQDRVIFVCQKARGGDGHFLIDLIAVQDNCEHREL